MPPALEYDFIYPADEIDELIAWAAEQMPSITFEHWDWGYEGDVAVRYVRCDCPNIGPVIYLFTRDAKIIRL